MGPELSEDAKMLARGIIGHIRRDRAGSSTIDAHGSLSYKQLSLFVEQQPWGKKISYRKAMGAPLGEIFDACVRAELPCLPAFVVRADTACKSHDGRPGDGFYKKYLMYNDAPERSVEELSTKRRTEIAEAERHACAELPIDAWVSFFKQR